MRWVKEVKGLRFWCEGSVYTYREGVSLGVGVCGKGAGDW